MISAGENDRLKALDRLMAGIHRQLDQGNRVPCVDPHIAHWWTSEDRERQEDAATACLQCPVLNTCSRYVQEFPEPSGVWAGNMRRHYERTT